MDPSESRVALVHDFLLDLRGGERVFGAICRMFPDADIFTAVYDERGTRGRFADRTVRTSYLQHLHPSARTFRALLPLYPSAIGRLDLSGYDLVISSSSAWAHGAPAPAGATHICYCHSPFRYAWAEREAVLESRGPLTRTALRAVFSGWRRWDRAAAQRVDLYLANSVATQARIAEFFGREATLLHPPIELSRFAPGPVGDYYMVLSELMAHKRLDVAVEAFNRLHLPLVVVGDGPDGGRLRALAGPTVTFTGSLPDARVAGLLASARALIVPGTEEFGLAAVEALASGRPVIAHADGGVLETVQDGRTGRLFAGSTAEALAAAVAEFDALAVDAAACVAAAARFGPDPFEAGIRRAIAAAPGPLRQTQAPRTVTRVPRVSVRAE
jgi:glycosyltransferase involved in cell wall biosynthesis